MARVIAGRYQLGAILGRGAMGIVYAAEHLFTGEALALKLIASGETDPELRLERFRREVGVAARIRHPGVVRVQDAGRTETDELFVVMERLHGRDLEAHLADGRVPRGLAVRILRAALEPLAAAHRVGVVHRDLKPSNLFVEEGLDRSAPRALLLDFGIAKIRDEGDSGTCPGIGLGTPRYMSPEQATQAGAVTPAADVWSVGVMLYRVLAGRLPFEGSTPFNVLRAVCGEPTPELDDAGSPLVRRLRPVVHACLEKDPARRPQDATELAARIDAALGATPDASRSGRPSLPPPAGALPARGARPPAGDVARSRERLSGRSSQLPVRLRSRRPWTLLGLAGVAFGLAALAWALLPEPASDGISGEAGDRATGLPAAEARPGAFGAVARPGGPGSKVPEAGPGAFGAVARPGGPGSKAPEAGPGGFGAVARPGGPGSKALEARFGAVARPGGPGSKALEARSGAFGAVARPGGPGSKALEASPGASDDGARRNALASAAPDGTGRRAPPAATESEPVPLPRAVPSFRRLVRGPSAPDRASSRRRAGRARPKPARGERRPPVSARSSAEGARGAARVGRAPGAADGSSGSQGEPSGRSRIADHGSVAGGGGGPGGREGSVAGGGGGPGRRVSARAGAAAGGKGDPSRGTGSEGSADGDRDGASGGGDAGTEASRTRSESEVGAGDAGVRPSVDARSGSPRPAEETGPDAGPAESPDPEPPRPDFLSF